MFRPMLLASIAALTLMGVTHVLANDSSAELATGGLVFIKNANVEMRSEDLFISQRRSARNTPSPEPDLNFIADSLAVAFGLVAAPYRLIMSRHVNRLNIRVTIHFGFVPVAAKDAIHRFGKCMVLAVREPSLRKTEIVSFGIGAICECCQHFAFGSTILAHQDGGTRSAEHSAPPCFGIEATVAPWCHCAGQPYAVCAILNTYQER